ARLDGDRHRAVDWDYGRRHFGCLQGHDVGLRGERVRVVGAFDADLLARHHADLPVFGAARLAAALGLRAADRGLAAEPRHDHHAGLRARQCDRRGADAPHPQRDAAGAQQRLCAHRPRQGTAGALGDFEARDAQCAHAGDHARCAGIRHAAVGRGADRADLHHSGFRQADHRRRVQPRLCGGAGRRAGHRDDLYLTQPPRRRALRAGQSTAEGVMADVPYDSALIERRADETIESPMRRALRRLKRRKGAVAGLIVIALFVLVAVFAPLIAPYDPAAQSWTAVRKAPSAAHWLGPEDVGRDVLARVIFGARASLLAGVISVAIAVSIGVPLGLISGYLGGWIDALLSRITDAMLAVPVLVLANGLAAFLGPSLGNAMIAIGVTTTPIFVRLTRGQVMAVKVEDYVEAARAIGN